MPSSYTEPVADVMARIKARQEQDRIELQRNPRWAVGWNADKPNFVLSKYGCLKKSEAATANIREFKIAMKRNLQTVNQYMGEVANNKTHIKLLEELKQSTLQEEQCENESKTAHS